MPDNAESAAGWSDYLIPKFLSAADLTRNWPSNLPLSDQGQAKIRWGLRGGHGKHTRQLVEHIDEAFAPLQAHSSKRRLRPWRLRADPPRLPHASGAHDPRLISIERIHLGDRYLVGSIGDTYGENPYTSNGGSNSTSNSANDHDVSNSVWIGLGVGVTIVVLLIAGCLFWCCRESSKQRALEAEAMTRQSVQGRSQMSRAGSVRSIQSRDSNPKRRDYRNSMRASIVDDPQDIFRQSVRSFSKRFIHADMETSDLGFDDAHESEEIYFKGVKCPRRPSGGRNALHDLYYGRPTMKKTRSIKRQSCTKSLPAQRDPVVLPGKKRSQSLLAPATSRLASTQERPRRKSDFGGAEISQTSATNTKGSVQEKAENEGDPPVPSTSKPQAATEAASSTSGEPRAKGSKKKLLLSDSEPMGSDTEVTTELSGSLHVMEVVDEKDPDIKNSKAPDSRHHHITSAKQKKTRTKASEPETMAPHVSGEASEKITASESLDNSQRGDGDSMPAPVRPICPADATETKPKKKKSKKATKKKSRQPEADRRPSRVDAL